MKHVLKAPITSVQWILLQADTDHRL